MKRRVIQIVVLLLLLGAIVNVAVAWVLAVSIDITARPLQSNSEFLKNGRWDYMTRRNIGAHQFSSVWQYHPMAKAFDAPKKNVVPSWSSARTSPSEAFLHATGSYTEVDLGDARGLPMLSLASEWRIEVHPSGRVDIPLHGYELTSWPWKDASGGTRKRIPLHPIWPGFAINTIFYAAMIWAIFFAPGMVKRTLRRRRGLCEHCGYDIRGQSGAQDAKCPECGTALPLPLGEGPPGSW